MNPGGSWFLATRPCKVHKLQILIVPIPLNYLFMPILICCGMNQYLTDIIFEDATFVLCKYALLIFLNNMIS
jgi:hypothetical protein